MSSLCNNKVKGDSRVALTDGVVWHSLIGISIYSILFLELKGSSYFWAN